MNCATKFGIRRKYIAVLLATMCLVLVACGGDKPLTDGIDNGAVTTAEPNIAETSVETEAGETADVSENDPPENSTATGSETPLTNNTAIDEPTVTAEKAETVKTEETAETSENIASTVETVSSDTEDREPEATTKTQNTDKPSVTSEAVTTPLIQVLPDGGLLLPDDEWE